MEAKNATQELREYQERISKMCYMDGDSIVLDRLDGTQPYFIDLVQCRTPEAILSWVYHLCQKAWITREYICLFLVFATSHHGIEIQ